MDKLSQWIKAERGRLVKLAEACGVTHSAVWQWQRVPAEKVLIVEQQTGIRREELRPDLYGDLPAVGE